jgi:hypothetical protein
MNMISQGKHAIEWFLQSWREVDNRRICKCVTECSPGNISIIMYCSVLHGAIVFAKTVSTCARVSIRDTLYCSSM